MNSRMSTVEGRIVDVISEDEYSERWRMYSENPGMASNTALETVAPDGKTYILPFRGKSDDRPGIYPDGCISFIKYPEEEESEFLKSNTDVVDFGSVSSINDFLSRNRQIRDMETSVLTDIDSVFIPPTSSLDSPEMKLFKEAIAAKRIDINKYAPRFGDNFLNDKRILKTNSITMNKLVSMCEKLDIEAELILRDSSSTVANPMNKELTIILTGGGDNE